MNTQANAEKSPKGQKMKPREIIALILFISLALSTVFALIRFIIAPAELQGGAPYEKIKSDYLLMLLQCTVGLIVMMLPTFIYHKWKLVVPGVMCILYYVFLYCAIFLGEIFSFYYRPCVIKLNKTKP